MARNNVKVKLRLPGINKVMRSPEMQSVVNAESARLAARAGSKFRMVPSPHRYVARSFVEPKPGVTVGDDEVLDLLRAVGSSG